MRFEVVTILARLAPVENRALEFEPAIREAGREDSKADCDENQRSKMKYFTVNNINHG